MRTSDLYLREHMGADRERCPDLVNERLKDGNYFMDYKAGTEVQYGVEGGTMEMGRNGFHGYATWTLLYGLLISTEREKNKTKPYMKR